jgi:translation initiation factor 2B subunit (eIF-2B alpha/beta/delta family)
MAQKNQGIIISGGTFNAEQVAIGKGAQAIQHIQTLTDAMKTDGKVDLAQTITDFLEVIENHKEELSDYDELLQAIQQIIEEVKKDKPNKLTLKGLLAAIKESVGSVAEIFENVNLLQNSIALVTGLTLI